MIPASAKRLLLVLFAALLTTAALAQKTYIVCVGISENRVNTDPLPACRNDIKDFAKVFDHYKNCEVFMLLDKNATRSHILTILKREFAKATPQDEIIFAYSGHGFDGGVSTYENNEVVYCSEVQSIMHSSQAKRKAIFMMACHSGSFTKRHANNTDNRRNYNRNSDVMIFVSSKDNEPSYLISGQRYSVFYDYLIRGLLGDADRNRDKLVTARELFNYVGSNVQRFAERIGQQQHPVMWGRFSDDMVIIKLKK